PRRRRLRGGRRLGRARRASHPMSRNRKERLDAWLERVDAVLAEYDASVQRQKSATQRQNSDVQRRLISRSSDASPSTLPRQTAIPASSAAFWRSASMNAV